MIPGLPGLLFTLAAFERALADVDPAVKAAARFKARRLEVLADLTRAAHGVLKLLVDSARADAGPLKILSEALGGREVVRRAGDAGR